MHVMFVGSVGQGKTYNAVRFAFDSPGKKVFANIDLQMPGAELHKWQLFDEIKNATCGTLFIDEADMWLNSREFAKLDNTARDVLKEHRKHHLRIVTTTQHVSFVDRIFRILCDEVRIVKKVSLPFIGFLWPDCVRPSIHCHHCSKVRLDDGKGDHFAWWGRWFGFGTLYFWDVYPPSVLGEDESANALDTEMRGIQPIGKGWCKYSQAIAAMYDTSARASVDARAMRVRRDGGSAAHRTSEKLSPPLHGQGGSNLSGWKR